MIARVAGILESIDGNIAVIAGSAAGGSSGGVLIGGLVPGIETALEVMLPAHAARMLMTKVGERITLHTHVVLDSPNQGASFVPRLFGFLTHQERAFFDLLTTVKGIGNRKAMRAMAEPIPVIAAAAHRGDVKALTQLPEIGKRLAETIIVELKGKLDAYLTADALEAGVLGGSGPRPVIGASDLRLTIPEQEAVDVLIRLGEQRVEAERKVARAVERATQAGASAKTPDEIVAAVFAGR